jgi:hypothetical protein
VIAPGIDVRGDRGYVLVSPSQVDGGSYRWSVDSSSTFAEAPEWLLSVSAAGARRQPGHFADIANGVPEGRRNDALASLCGKFLRVGLSPRQTLNFLTYWNSQNSPPLEASVLETAVLNIAARDLRKKAPR